MEGERVAVDQRLCSIVIGRNEGARLQASLASAQAARMPLVYVDSGSIDGSSELARAIGIPVVELDSARPFSAARARNEGLAEALRRWQSIEFVMFLDGDCVLDPDFPFAALTEFDQHPNCAIVTGHLTERHPDASVYNRLCAIEWRSPAGRIENMSGLGGIMMARVSAFRDVGGFDEQAIAGEEPDLGVRLGLAGYSIIKIDQAMATHDAQMMHFAQWWKRAVRSGHALAHRYVRHGRTRFRDGRREIRSVLFWGFVVPLCVIALLWPTRGLSLLLLGGYALLGWRIYRHFRRSGLPSSDCWLVTRFILYGKFAELVGVIRYGFNRVRGCFHIIEYK
jgi:GT2 family glycosyltransferase